MRCSLLHLWLGTSLVTTLLTCGCQHTRKACPTCGGSTVASAGAVSPSTAYTANMAATSAPSPGVAAPPGTEAAVLHTTAKPASEAASTNTPTVAAGEAGSAPAPLTQLPADAPSRRTFTDLTAHPHFAHDPNYAWLVGVLDYSKIQGAWILRYASVEEEDRYGGSVTLHQPGKMTAFKNGQLVRVEGHLINPDSQQLRPAFEVQTIRPAEQ